MEFGMGQKEQLGGAPIVQGSRSSTEYGGTRAEGKTEERGSTKERKRVVPRAAFMLTLQ
jgi:hypothetical protein